jgi:hypothetical protein
MRKRWATACKEIGLHKPILQLPATSRNRDQRIVAPEGEGSSPVGHPLTQVGRHRTSVF